MVETNGFLFLGLTVRAYYLSNKDGDQRLAPRAGRRVPGGGRAVVGEAGLREGPAAPAPPGLGTRGPAGEDSQVQWRLVRPQPKARVKQR